MDFKAVYINGDNKNLIFADDNNVVALCDSRDVKDQINKIYGQNKKVSFIFKDSINKMGLDYRIIYYDNISVNKWYGEIMFLSLVNKYFNIKFPIFTLQNNPNNDLYDKFKTELNNLIKVTANYAETENKIVNMIRFLEMEEQQFVTSIQLKKFILLKKLSNSVNIFEINTEVLEEKKYDLLKLIENRNTRHCNCQFYRYNYEIHSFRSTINGIIKYLISTNKYDKVYNKLLKQKLKQL